MGLTACPYQLDRFLVAQEGVYEQAGAEIRCGAKRPHWMWVHLSADRTPRQQRHAIGSLNEARGYVDQLVLGRQLRDCDYDLRDLNSPTAREVFRDVDAS